MVIQERRQLGGHVRVSDSCYGDGDPLMVGAYQALFAQMATTLEEHNVPPEYWERVEIMQVYPSNLTHDPLNRGAYLTWKLTYPVTVIRRRTPFADARYN